MAAALVNSRTVARYLREPTLFALEATVTGTGMSSEIKKGINYHYFTLNHTIFHPQGGGQPADKGTINGVAVDFVYKKIVDGDVTNFDVWHCFKEAPNFINGEVVQLQVDESARRSHMRMHSAGHAIAQMVETRFPHLVGYTGNHTPGDGYVKFRNTSKDQPLPADLKSLQAQLQADLTAGIQAKIPVAIIYPDEGTRQIQMGDFRPVPCGGTHVSNWEELGSVVISGAKNNQKENTLTIKYEVRV